METKNNTFKKFFNKDSITIIVAAFIFAMIGLLVLDYLVANGLTTKINPDKVRYSTTDQDIDISNKVYDSYTNSSDYKLYLVGSSSMREIIISENYVEKILSEEMGLDSKCYLMSLSNLNLLETLQIVDSIKKEDMHGKGAVVIGINNNKIVLNEVNDRLMLKSDKYIDYIRNDYYVKTVENGIYTYHSNIVGSLLAKKYIQRFARSIEMLDYKQFNAVIPAQHHFYDGIENVKYDKNVKQEKKDQKNYNQNDIDFYNKIMTDIINTCYEKNLDVMLLELPYNTFQINESINQPNSRYLLHRQETEKIAQQTGCYYFNYNYNMGYEEDDFFDIRHVNNDEIRIKYLDLFLENFFTVIN